MILPVTVYFGFKCVFLVIIAESDTLVTNGKLNLKLYNTLNLNMFIFQFITDSSVYYLITYINRKFILDFSFLSEHTLFMIEDLLILMNTSVLYQPVQTY